MSSVPSRTPNDCADLLRTSRCMKAASSIRSTGNRPLPLPHTHGSNRSSAPRPQRWYRTFHGRSPAKQRLAGKRHHRDTPRALDHSSPAALPATAMILCRPAVSPGHRFLPDQCRFPVPGPPAQFPDQCLLLAQSVPLLLVRHRLCAIPSTSYSP